MICTVRQAGYTSFWRLMLLWQPAAAADWYVDWYLHSGYQPNCHTLANSAGDNLHTTGAK